MQDKEWRQPDSLGNHKEISRLSISTMSRCSKLEGGDRSCKEGRTLIKILSIAWGRERRSMSLILLGEG